MKTGIVVDNELNHDKRVLREIDILKEAGYKIHVICFGFDKKVYEDPVGIIVTRIFISQRLKNFLFFILNTVPLYEWMWSSKIRRFITMNHIDSLHVHDLYMSKSGINGIKKSKKTIPLILDLHENYSFAVTTYNWTKGLFRGLISRPKAWKKKEKEYLLNADRIVVLCDEFRDDLCLRYPGLSKDNFFSFPNVPNLALEGLKIAKPVSINFGEGKIILFYFGVVAERRGIYNVLEVIERLAFENFSPLFLIIGPVDKKDKKLFNKKIHSDLLAKNVHYIPWIDLKELPGYLSISDICVAPFLVNPQHESGVANKIFDYMLGGKPIIASACKPQKSLIEKYNCGIVYHDLEELISAIKLLAVNPELRYELGENGRNAVINEYNVEFQKNALLKLYSGLNTGNHIPEKNGF